MTAAGATTELPDGALLGGKYRIERLLGAGGMGAVYLAENTDIGRKVAIKVLHPNFARDEGILHRFRMEARAAGAIGHPGIVDVLDLGTTETGAEFIVMERLEGETLGSLIKRNGNVRPDELVPIVCEVLEALAVAHEKGVVHRDLKPENIFLCARPVGRAKILDFGISKFSGAEDVSITRTGSIMGSPMYMSPEQAKGSKNVGAATDLYAIGAILYEGLGGRPPFRGDSYNELIVNLITEQHEPLGQVRPELPAALATIVDRLLAKDPAERPGSASQTRSALMQALGQSSTDVDLPPAGDQLSGFNPLAATMAPASPTATSSGEQNLATVPSTEPPAAVQHRRRTAGLIVGALIAAGVMVGGAAWITRAPKAASSNAPVAPAPAPAAQPATAASTAPPVTAPTTPAASNGSAGSDSSAVTPVPATTSAVTPPATTPQGSADVRTTTTQAPKDTSSTTRRRRPPADQTTTKPADGTLTIDKSNPYP